MSDKVISIFSKRAEKESDKKDDKEAESQSFDDIMKANEAKKEKMAKERAQANKSVLRSYRIKN